MILVMSMTMWLAVQGPVVKCGPRIVSATSRPATPTIWVTLRGDDQQLSCAWAAVEKARTK